MSGLRSVILLFMLISVSAVSVAQDEEIQFSNMETIDPNRYEDTRGNPYYFETWVTGSIIRNDGFIFENIKMNYNGYTKTFDVLAGHAIIELEEKMYLRVDIDAEVNQHQGHIIMTDDFAFQRNLHPRFDEGFVIILLNENTTMLVKEYWVDAANHEVQELGRTITYKRFNRKANYFIKSEGQLQPIRLKKKNVLETLDRPEVEKFVEDNKIRLDSERELIEVVRFYANLNT